MNPITLFYHLVAIAGGLFVCGLAGIALVCVWAVLKNWAERYSAQAEEPSA